MIIMRSFLLILFLFPLLLQAQTEGILRGSVINKNTLQPLTGASVQITGGPGAVTDSLGRFRIQLPVGSYGLTATAVGYRSQSLFNLVVTSGNEIEVTVELESAATELTGVTVRSNRRTARAATLESPLSIQRLTAEEIRSNPGGNFDISRVIQTLPGVGGTSGSVGGFRNDIIIRGGAPNENVFYLDGIEIPNINHFATQGSGGGPTGILNVSFIEDVKLSTSAFDARYDNALSSVFQFRQINGNPRRLQGNVRLSATELAATFEGPIRQEKTTFLASARRSYLQFLFKAIDLPIRPNYWDFQAKVTHRIDPKTTLTFLGVGAIDEFSFAAPREATPEKLYIINSNPTIEQWSYTVGATLRRQISNGFWNLALSRNTLNNSLDQFENNRNPIESERNLRVRSQERETKLRYDWNKTIGAWKWAWGGVAQVADFSNNTFSRFRKALYDESGNLVQPEQTANFTSPINPFLRYGAFAQAGRRLFNDRVGISMGIRADGNTFTTNGANPLRTLSPRVALSYVLADKWTLNASVGRYYRLAPYTVLGFADNNGTLVNKGADYTRSDHYVSGVEFLPTDATRITLEGFYKRYANVPVSVRDGISLANLGGDFGVLGNEAVETAGKGKAYGFEFFAQQKLTKQFFGIISYTYFKSRYSGSNGVFVPSAWENTHLLSTTLGYKLPRNWELGLRFRYQGGVPYTPFDLVASQRNYLSLGSGLLDYNQLNTLRLESFHAADIRIDKKWNFPSWTLDLFLDLSNFYRAMQPSYPRYTFARNTDNTGFATTDGGAVKPNGSNAVPLLLRDDDGNITPTFGFIIAF
jgi:hypothetical protein